MGTLHRQTTLSKQASAVFNMTFLELQKSVGSGKPFGSMNMDELLSAVAWDQSSGPVPDVPLPVEGAQHALLPAHLTSVALHPDYSGKTVEEVWNAIHTIGGGGSSAGAETTAQPDYQSVTLGSFLQSVGLGPGASTVPAPASLPDPPQLQVHTRPQPPVQHANGRVHVTAGPPPVKAEPDAHAALHPAAPARHPVQPRSARNRPAAAPADAAAPDSANLPLRGAESGSAATPRAGPPTWPLHKQHSPPLLMPSTPQHSQSFPQGQLHMNLGRRVPAAGSTTQLPEPSGLISTGAEAKTAAGTSAPGAGPATSAAAPKLPMQASPVPGAALQPLDADGAAGSADGAAAAAAAAGAAARAARQRKRKEPDVVDERTARLQKRMVKNRESAARSRQRKQQYTSDLECQVEELKVANRQLLERVIAHCPPPPDPNAPSVAGLPLRRTRTTPL